MFLAFGSLLLSSSWQHVVMELPPGSNSASTDKAPLKAQTCEQVNPSDTVTPVTAGGTVQVKLKGSATHGGGGCVFSLSYDQGQSFTMIYKTDSQCPITQNFQVPIPKNAANGPALFTWSWIPIMSGQKEYYMTCSKVMISGGSGELSGGKMRGPQLPVFNLPGYPDAFQNNNAGGNTKPWVDSISVDSSSSSNTSGLIQTPLINGTTSLGNISAKNISSVSLLATLLPSPEPSKTKDIGETGQKTNIPLDLSTRPIHLVDSLNSSNSQQCKPGTYRCNKSSVEVCSSENKWVSIPCGPKLNCANIGDSYVCV